MQLIDSISPVFDPTLRQTSHDKRARTVVVALPPGDQLPVDGSPTTPPTTPPHTEGPQ